MRALRRITIVFLLVAGSCATNGDLGYGVGVGVYSPGYYDPYYYNGYDSYDYGYPYGNAPYVYGGGHYHYHDWDRHYPYTNHGYGGPPNRNVTVARPPTYGAPSVAPPTTAPPAPSAPAGRATTIARPPGR